jgi:hypothetical protein
MRHQVVYGQYREYLEIAAAVIGLARKRGLPAPTLLAPVTGTANDVIWETDYPDLPAFQRDNGAFYADAELMEQWRRLWQHVVQGSVQDELLQEAPRIA